MPYKLYRTIRRKEPALIDFWSDFALGQLPVRVQLREPLEWAGISTFDDPGVASDKAIQYGHGRYLAILEIDEQRMPVIVKKTGGPHHYSVMGPPSFLRGLAAQAQTLQLPATGVQ